MAIINNKHCFLTSEEKFKKYLKINNKINNNRHTGQREYGPI